MKPNPNPLTFEESYRVRQLLKQAGAASEPQVLGFSIQSVMPMPARHIAPYEIGNVRAIMNEKAELDRHRYMLEGADCAEAKASKPKLICMVGLPYAGKSTHISKMDCPIVAPDAIRLALHGQRFIPEMEPLVWQYAQTMVKALFLTGADRVVLDACNVTRDNRSQWIKPDDWDIEFRHITTSREMCRERAENAGDNEILPVIERMSKQWEPLRYVDPLIGMGQSVRIFSARGEELPECPAEWAKKKSC